MASLGTCLAESLGGLVETGICRQLVEESQYFWRRRLVGAPIESDGGFKPTGASKRATEPSGALRNTQHATGFHGDALFELFLEFGNSARHHAFGISQATLLDRAVYDLREQVERPTRSGDVTNRSRYTLLSRDGAAVWTLGARARIRHGATNAER